MNISFYLSESQEFSPEDYHVVDSCGHNDIQRWKDQQKPTSSNALNQANKDSVNDFERHLSSSSNRVSHAPSLVPVPNIPPTTNNVRTSSLLVKANGGNVVISEEARKRSADVLAKISESIPTSSITTIVPMSNKSQAPASILKGSSSNSRVSSLLQKSSGGHVVISDAAAEKGLQWLNRIETPFEANDTQKVSASLDSKGRTSSLLQKANGGPVQISESARKKAVTFFDSVIPQTGGDPLHNMAGRSSMLITPMANHENQNGHTSSLLRTASGSKVVISEAARHRASQFLTNVNSTTVNVVTPLVGDQHPSSAITSSVHTITSSSFNSVRKPSLLQKANGRNVVISEDARRRASHWIAGGGHASNSIPSTETPMQPLPQVNVVTRSLPRQSDAMMTSASVDSIHHGPETASFSNHNPPSAGPVDRFNIYDAFSQLCDSTFPTSPSLPPTSILDDETITRDDTANDINAIQYTVNSGIQRTLFHDDMMPHAQVDSAELVSSKSDQLTMGASKSLERSEDDPQVADNSTVGANAETANDGERKFPFQFDFVPASKPNQHGLVTPCITRASLLMDPIWPEEVATWDEIMNRVYVRKSFDVDFAKELAAVSSTQVLTSALELEDNMIRVSNQHQASLLACEATDKGSNAQLSECFDQMILSFLRECPRLSKRWAIMQLNWIVWTLVSYQRRFPSLYPQCICTLDNIEQCLRSRIELYYFKKAIAEHRQTSRASSLTPASKHFLKTGAMSPLHRCCEIVCLVWPLCLCVSIATQESKQSIVVQITDGWYWARAVVDKDIEDLIRRGKLRDGYKIIVFTAPITTGDSQQSGGTVKLHINSIRLAHRDAPLGFVNPRYLHRGISLKSILPDGGSIFSIRFETVALSVPYSRVKLIDQEGELLIDGITATSSEINWIKARLEDLQEKALAKMMSQETKRRKFADDEDHYHHSMNKFTNNFNNFKFESLFQLEVHAFQDILAKCELSGSLAWIKVSTTNGDESDFMDTTFRFAVGQQYLLTNTKPLKNSSSTLTLTTTNQSALTCLTKSRIPFVTPQKSSSSVGTSSSTSKSNTIVMQNRMKSFDSLSSIFRCKSHIERVEGCTNTTTTAGYIGSDLSVKLIVVDWFEDGPLSYSVSSALDTEWCSLTNLRILCIDESNYSMEILCPTFKKYLEKLPWLKKNKEIYVEHLLIKEVDEKYQIARTMKTDRTSITVWTATSGCHTGSNISANRSFSNSTNTSVLPATSSHITSSDVLSQSLSLSQSQSTQISGKKKKFVSPRSTKKSGVGIPASGVGSSSHQQVSLLAYTTTTASTLSSRLLVLCEEECKRFTALRNSQLFYPSHRLPTLELSTVRTTCVGFIERYPIVDLSNHFPEWRTVIVHMNREVVIALCEAIDVEVMIPGAMSAELSNPIQGVISMQQLSEAIELFSSELNQSMMITHVIVHVAPHALSID